MWRWLGRGWTVVVSLVAAGGVWWLLERGWVSGWGWDLLFALFIVVAGVGSVAVSVRIQEQDQERQEGRAEAERALPPGAGFDDSRPAGLVAMAESGEPSAPWAPPVRKPAAVVCPPDGGVVQAAVFSPVAGYLAQALTGGEVVLWNLAAPGPPRQVVSVPGAGLAGPGDAAAVAFSPDGVLLACGGAVWDLTELTGPRFLTRLVGAGWPVGGVSAVAFDGSGTVLVARSGDGGQVAVWDVEDPAGVRHRVTLARGGPDRPRRGPRGGADATVSVAPARLAVSTMTGAGEAAQGAGVLVAAAVSLSGPRERVRLWTLAPAEHPHQVATIDPINSGNSASVVAQTRVHGVALSPTGGLLAVATDADVSVTPYPGTGTSWHQGEVGLWEVSGAGRPRRCFWLRGRGTSRHMVGRRRRERARAAMTLTGHAGVARAVAFSPTGRLLATGGDDGTALVWDVTTPSRLRLLEVVPHGDPVHAVAFDPTGTLLATTGTTDTRLWPLTAAASAPTTPTGPTGG